MDLESRLSSPSLAGHLSTAGLTPPASAKNFTTDRSRAPKTGENWTRFTAPAIPAMDAWTAPLIPKLPGRGPALVLFDTARGVVASTHSGRGGREATIYVCGITPYDATHVGHAATMITFDVLMRTWRDAGVRVRYVQNVTDIDDPLLKRAARDQIDWRTLADREIALFKTDMEALRIVPPDHYVGAVAAIPAIVERVTQLLDAGVAYRLDDGTGDVYFDLSKAPSFGSQSHLSREEMLRLFPDRGGDPARAGKRDPLDPLLWRGQREGEPSWPGGALGAGRPGWHIECAVIAQQFLGDRIDVQGGGSDLSFPHHECSSAHAEAISGVTPFAGHYVHTAMIGLNGEKMSKRKGNLVFVSGLLKQGVDPMAIRLALLASHYRSDRQWSDELLAGGAERLAKWRKACARPSGPPGAALLNQVRAKLADDLDTPGALQLLDEWADAALRGQGGDRGAPQLVRNAVDGLLGVRL